MAKANKLNVIIYRGNSKRAHVLCEAMVSGVTKAGDKVISVTPAVNYRGGIHADVAVFYGLKDNLMRVYKEYIAAGKKTILMDLGYWGRTEGGRLSGYHRVVANNLHPNYYYQMITHDSNRFLKFNVDVKPKDVSGDHVLLAGMSEKAAWVFDLKPLEYEKRMITEIRKHTDKPILYRPKPSWKGAAPLPGTTYSPPDEPLQDALDRSFVVVTHHSNVAIDAIVNGKPCIVTGHGVGMAVSTSLDCLEEPYFPYEEKRMKWLSNIAYTQWNVKEIQAGKPWKHLKKEGVL